MATSGLVARRTAYRGGLLGPHPAATSTSSSSPVSAAAAGVAAMCRQTGGDLNTPEEAVMVAEAAVAAAGRLSGSRASRSSLPSLKHGPSRSFGGFGASLWAVALLALVFVRCEAGSPNEIHSGIGLKNEPVFGEAIQNVTVAAGRDATLSCIVDSLGDFRVGWLKVDSQTILTLQKRVVTHNTRISVTHDEHRTWNLHIKNVKETDRGCYMCQINTPVMKNKVGCIEVHVPPDIINEVTSSDTTVHEGDTVRLQCVAEGYPVPEITWKREDGRSIVLKSSGRDGVKSVESVAGGNLTMENVSRKQMGAYLCIASNKVPPSVSKRIIVSVYFSPVVKVDNMLIGAPLETEVEIQCHVEAYPRAINYWAKDNGEILLDGTKYRVVEMVDVYRVTMKLIISNFTRDDAGQYKCVSTNSLGKSDTSIRLYVIEIATARTTTEHQYYPYPTTPHSKSVNSLDLLRRDGHHVQRTRDGPGGSRSSSDGSMSGLGVDLADKDQNRQRQRQRLELGDARNDNGFLGGGFHPGQMDGGGGGTGGAAGISRPLSASSSASSLLFLCLISLLGLLQHPAILWRPLWL